MLNPTRSQRQQQTITLCLRSVATGVIGYFDRLPKPWGNENVRVRLLNSVRAIGVGAMCCVLITLLTNFRWYMGFGIGFFNGLWVWVNQKWDREFMEYGINPGDIKAHYHRLERERHIRCFRDDPYD